MAKGRKKPKLRTARVTEMAEFAGVSEQTIRNWMKEHDWPGDRSDGSVCLWDLALWRAGVSLDVATGIDPEMLGSDSAALERFRMARAQQEEIKLQSMRADYLAKDDVRTLLMDAASLYKSAAERLIRQFGDEAAEIIEEAIREIERRAKERWGNDSAESKGGDG